MGTSLLVVLLGMLVPVLAAAPFYVAQSRREQAEDREYAERVRQQAEESEAADWVLPEQRSESDYADRARETGGSVELKEWLGAHSRIEERAPEHADQS